MQLLGNEFDFSFTDIDDLERFEQAYAQLQDIPVLDHVFLPDGKFRKKLPDHGKGLGVSHHGGLRIFPHKGVDGGGMIRLHMLYHKVVGLSFP